MKTKLSFLARSVILLWMLVVGSVVHVDAKTVYYVNECDWTSVQIHFWGGSNGSTWGELPSMIETGETVNSHKIYSYEIGDNTNCLFKNGGGAGQTPDLTPLSDKVLYFYNGSWKEYHESRVIYLKSSAVNYWAEYGAIQKATFKPSGTVVTGTLVNEDGNVYKFVMPAGWDDTVYFGRYDPTDPDNAWDTTGDISIQADKNYVISFAKDSPHADWGVYSPPPTDDYYLVVNNNRSAGEEGEVKRYKFQPVLIREQVNPVLSPILYTLTLPDFVLTGAQGRAENPNCFESGRMYYTIQNSDGSVIYEPDNNYQLGYGSGKRTETSNGGLTNVQMESYRANIKKDAAEANGFNFFLEESTLAKSYTWYLNIGNSAYEPSDRDPRFTSNPQSVAIAANQLVEGHTKNAIVEQNNASGVQDYYLTGNLKMGAGAMTWQPVENKMKMTRMFFKNGKSTAVAPNAVATDLNCDSIVYVLQMVRPQAGWGNMFLSMAGERNLDAYKNGIATSDVTAWWATLIRPQVFTNKDAQWNFGGLEVNGSLNDGTYTKSYGNTSQAINPILANTVTGYTAYFNMTNATYRLVYYTESASNDEGLFIIGPAVAKDGEIDGDETYHAADGRKVKLSFNSETGAYEAIGIKLTNGQGFRFANIKQTTTVKTEGGYETSSEMKSAYESYYEEDDILPAHEGEPRDAAWFAAKTWETDYFNLLSEPKVKDDVQEITGGTPVTFGLDDGRYNVRFYTKYLGENDETVTNAYYTIDENIPCPVITTEDHLPPHEGFGYYKNWSSHLAYKFDADNVSCYYVKSATYTKDLNAAGVTHHNRIVLAENTTGYLPSEFAMILASDDPTANDNIYIIKPGDPYGHAEDCKITDASKYSKENGTGCFEPVVDGLSNCGDKTSKLVGPGEKNADGKYTSRNYLFSTLRFTEYGINEKNEKYVTRTYKDLGFWRIKESNTYISAHKCVLRMPCDDDDWEVGAYTDYDPEAGVGAAKNSCLFIIEGEEFEDENDDNVTGIADNSISEQQNSNVFNVMGMKLNAPGKGINIINGKKVLRK